MTVIWKFRLPISRTPVIDMPDGAAIVHVGLDPEGTPSIWAIVDEAQPFTPRRFRVAMTGEPLIPDSPPGVSDTATARGAYLGTFVQGAIVAHVFAAVL